MEMPPNETELFDDFTEMKDTICQKYCYYWIYTKKCEIRFCRDCPLREFRIKLKKYLDKFDDDGR